MLDIKYIREHAEEVQQAADDKHIDLNVQELLTVDKERVERIQEIEKLSAQKNALNSKMQGATEHERKELIAKGTALKEQLEKKEPVLRAVKQRFDALMSLVPTIPAPDVPRGTSEDDNVVVYEKGEKPVFDFTPKTHVALAQDLDIIDFKQGVKVSGFRGYYLKNEGAELAMALMMYAMHKMIAKGFTPMIPPTLVKEFALYGTGYFAGNTYDGERDEVYQVVTSDDDATGKSGKEKKFLVGTAEPSLLAYYANTVLEKKDLPLKICGYSQCYRSEIGSYGKDTTGLYRVHEFMKVEQVVLMEADRAKSEQMQEEMVQISEEILAELGLPYRKLAICTGDMSAGKYRMFDLEVWMPGLKRWGETGSASNFLDWQARRLQVQYKDDNGKKKHVYMLNNTVLPSPRPLIALLENFQQKDGSVRIPRALHAYMPGGKESIALKNKEDYNKGGK